MLRFTLRELLWVTLAFAALLSWRLEASRASHWREQAEHAMGQLESQTLEQMTLNAADPRMAPSYDAPLREAAASEPVPLGTALLHAAVAWLP